MKLLRNAIVKINYFNDMPDEFTLLLAMEKNKLSLLINGFIPVAQLDFTHLIPHCRLLHAFYDKRGLKVIV